MGDKLITQWDEDIDISSEELQNIVKAVSQVYPMIVYANLTQNTYAMLRNEDFLCNEVENSGNYDDLIDNNVENIHQNYKHLFQECFSREHLIQSFAKGKTEVYAEIYQKNRRNEYHWVSSHVIRIENESGDVCQICLNRFLDGIVQERHGDRK
jgi:hypothetical protein